MPETFVQASDFNMAMHALRRENTENTASIREEIGALRGLIQTNYDYRVDQATKDAQMDGRVKLLEDKENGRVRLVGGLSLTVGGLLAWRILELAIKK